MSDDFVDPERKADSLSTRREKIGKDRRGEFDAYYGGLPGVRSTRGGGAGKGDRLRRVNGRRYDIGWELLQTNLTPERRKELEDEWHGRGQQEGDSPPNDRPDGGGASPADA